MGSVTMQTALLIILAGLVVLLSTLLYVRIRREGRKTALFDQSGLNRFSELIRASIVEGDIQAAATHLSHMLKEQCGCRKIVFLRRRGGVFELSYFEGLGSFNRRALQARYTPELIDVLKSHLLPDTIDHLHEHLPKKLMDALRSWGCDVCFPIFWREHLYGIYFIAGNDETRSPSFRLVMSSMAQTLSAAYHIKWHEHQAGRLQEQLTALTASRKLDRFETGAPSAALLKLVRHRDSETLVGRIVDEVRKDLDLEHCAFFYSQKDSEEPVRYHCDGTRLQVSLPSRESFERLVSQLQPDVACDVESLGESDEALTPLQRGLSEAGLSHLVSFQLTPRRSGILVWSDRRPISEIIAGINRFRPAASELMANAESLEEIEGLSYTDGLTGLANQRYFMRRLEEEIDRARRYGRSVALIMFDLDDLKGINDRYGHQAGDEVLRQLGDSLRKSIRSIDVVARYGGDEFCIIMPESDRADCEQFMNRLQQKIAASRFRINQASKDLTCTVSLGGAVFPQSADNSEKLIYAADMALLKAKELGRNRALVS
jgi:diguanylate cyclase (GGDEF)-like protein